MNADSYRERIAAALDDGWRFAGLHASSDGTLVRTLLVDANGSTRLETVVAENGTVHSIVDLAPAAGWDEREAHDLHGVGFAGHEPLRPLVDHDARLDHWTVPVRGDDAYQVAVGPIHAGVIESGHFRFHVVGERILHLDARLFYKHRGLERAAEGTDARRGDRLRVTRLRRLRGHERRRLCARVRGRARPHADGRARARAHDPARARADVEPPQRHRRGLRRRRPCRRQQRFAALTERARRLNAALTGHRFLFGSIRVGGSDLTLDLDQVRAAREEVAALRADSSRSWRELLFNASFQDRLPDIGVVGAAEGARLGAVGPAARAAGVAEDARASSARLSYDGFVPVVPRRAAGDVQARLEQRALELLQTFDLLEELLDDPLEPATAEPAAPERPIGVGRVESPRGATSCIVERRRPTVERLRLRTGSYANWPVVAYAAADNLLPTSP